MEATLHVDERPSVTSECSPLLSEHNAGASSTPPPQHDETTCDTSAKKVQHLIIDGKGSNWHQSPIFAPQEREREPEDSLPILDFDLLCATIAMQREPLSVEVQRDACEVGVQRMWEGGVLDCFEDKEIALRTICCPSVTYGKNLSRAGFGSCIAKGGVHFLLLVTAIVSYILFLCAYGRQYLYTAITVLICAAAYASFYRIQIRRKFNIKGSDLDGVVSAFDDSLNHFICGCCALCQEARTLEMNNVQDGNWRGRGDTIWVGSYAMPSAPQGTESPECSVELKQPVVGTMYPEDTAEGNGRSWTRLQGSSNQESTG